MRLSIILQFDLIRDRFVRGFCVALMTVGALCAASCSTPQAERIAVVSKWDRFERSFTSRRTYPNPIQDAELRVVFTSPSGQSRLIYGFWDGSQTWKVRFAPNELGKWYYSTSCSNSNDDGLHRQTGAFLCIAPNGRTRFDQHGPVRVARDGRHLEHEDGTPFFWLADTAWNGALLSTPAEWDHYLRERRRQQFTAVQWVATQWRASPTGDRESRAAFADSDRIAVNPEFFRQLDAKADAVNRAGLLNVPVLLWAIGGGARPQINPGYALQEDQAILLARYMIARWGANDVIWILPGDGDYRGPRAERWKRIGRASFGEEPHAPVVLHPGGMQWVLNEFLAEKWLDIHGYQSGHGDDERTLRWIFEGPPATDWKKEPARPFINLEPPYENHLAYQSQTRIAPLTVRRAIYWSLLNAPTAGVSYGGHGVWGWDDGAKPPMDHPRTGVPLPWQKALLMPAAEQMAHVATFFNSIDFWRLRPAPEVLASQPGQQAVRRHIAAARSEAGDLLVVYVPEDRNVEILQKSLPPNFRASWFSPRTGEKPSVVAVLNDQAIQFATPDEGDWLLLVKSAE
ncbi:MAG: DUF4038 domain-containing protein [Verrucomicrobia bacterium]|nr:DUF4038 domain-containing protein [Verrucomicrobiota bacterium]